MFNVTLVGDRELFARFDTMGPGARAMLDVKVKSLAIELQGHVISKKLSGQVLNVRTGALRRSIQETTQRIGTAIWGKVYSSGDVKYAGIHEFGGTIQHPGGTAYIPMAANFLRGDSGPVRFISNAVAASLGYEPPRTKAHPIPMPKRSFLRSSLADKRDDIISGMKEAVVEGIARAGGLTL